MIAPFIFILDLDGTIIGDCSYQILINSFENICKYNKIKTNCKNILLDQYHTESKLIRPYFKYFIENMKKSNNQNQFYIYTASEKSWANKEISLIENSNKIKFNRPIFTRDDCILDSFGIYKKSVEKIIPKIQKNNKGIHINKKNILVIDNNKVFIDYTSNLITCPSYEYLCFYDLWDSINKEQIKNENIQNLISNLINTNKICKWNPYETCAYNKEYRYKWLYKKYKRLNKMNKKYESDLFWKKLTDGLLNNNITSFDKHNILLLSKLSCKNEII